jgi:hypothetical protein
MPQLGGEDLQTACRLILECYDRHGFEELVRVRFSVKLEWIVRDAGLAEQVAELFEFAARHHLTGRLLKEAAEYPPPKVKLRPLAERYPPDPDEPSRPAAELIGEAVGGFEVVPDLLKQDQVRAQLTPFAQAYQEAAAHIDLLRGLKTLHDCLHTIQLQYREIAESAQRITEGRRGAGALESYADGLELAAEQCGYLDGDKWGAPVSGLPNPGPEKTWLRNLRRAVEDLRAAAEAADGAPAADSAETAIHLLGRILGRDPNRLQWLILNQFAVVPFPALVFSLRAIRDAPAAPAVRGRLADGLTALEAVHLRLARLVAEHTAWQNLDNSLRVALDSWYELLATDRRRAVGRAAVAAGVGGPRAEEEDSQTEYANRLLQDWPDVAEKFAEVRDRAAPGRRLDRLTGYAKAIETAAAARDFGHVFDVFEPFAQLALRCFIEVDKEVLALAGDLARVGEPLRAILEVIRR